MVEVKVYVPFKSAVEYIVDVEDPNNIEEIKEKLYQKDPSDWNDIPNFYEVLGANFREFVKEVTEDDIFPAD
jgi:hypothetical protein